MQLLDNLKDKKKYLEFCLVFKRLFPNLLLKQCPRILTFSIFIFINILETLQKLLDLATYTQMKQMEQFSINHIRILT